MSGEAASFLAGGEFPIPVPQGDNISIEWKEYGISLTFTPTIVGGNRINLHVRPEVSQLSDVGAVTLNSIEVPSLTTRRAETTVELGSGQSFAIAGLLNNSQTQSVKKFPFLGDVPILGSLFRSTRFQNDESELVIIITPYIVEPTTEEKLALPTDGFSTPSDTDMLFKLRNTNSDPNAPVMSGPPRAKKIEPVKVQSVAVPPEPKPVPKQEEKVTPPPPAAKKAVKPAAPKVEKKAPTPKPPKKTEKAPVQEEVELKGEFYDDEEEPAKPEAQKDLPVSTPVPEKKAKPTRPPGLGGFIME
jgi:pilus assembly protein CpaC